MRYKAIIFDMDGTIVDTEHIWEQTNKEIIVRRGIEFTPELKKELASLLQGLGLPESCQIIKDVAGLDDDVETIIQETKQTAHHLYRTGIIFVKGFLEFHNNAINHGLKVGVATNADDGTLHITREKLNLEQLFGKHIYNISHVNNVSKPDPALYLHAAEQLGEDPDNCVAIEDSAHGIQAAKGAGILCFGINTANKPEQLRHADVVIDGYEEIDLKRLLKIDRK